VLTYDVHPFIRQPQHVKTIEDALHSLTTIETVSVQSRQGISVEATKQMLIEQLPPILILHLKRFVYDPITGIGKNTKTVRFGPDLDIRSGA
jgi:ubiquitin carboxyl-terminal hydrolase 10